MRGTQETSLGLGQLEVCRKALDAPAISLLNPTKESWEVA